MHHVLVVMDRRSFYISVLFLGAFLICLSSSKELSRELTCFYDVLSLDCGSRSIIAIHQAYFTSQRQENHTCDSLASHEYIEDEDAAKLNNRSYCYEDARVSVNKRCSGLRKCNFTYSEEPEKSCSNPDGVLIVQYDCVRADKINKYCNAKITATEGYITQPGYPKYYPQLPECSWSLSAAEGQTIVGKILHLHLSAATDITPTESEHDAYIRESRGLFQLTERVYTCDTDSLSVLEGNMKRFSVCGEDLKGLKAFEADASNDLVLKFKSTSFSPNSGFLAYFKIEGCPDMPAGEDSYLVERNGTAATYACRNDMVFNDTMENTRFVYCIRNHHWSNTLSPCIQSSEETTIPNSISHKTYMDHQVENITDFNNETVTYASRDPKFTEDILIPCIIIAILIIGNSIIIVIICIMRRNSNNKKKDEEQEADDSGQPKTASP